MHPSATFTEEMELSRVAGSVDRGSLGGTDSDAETGGARQPYGILPHALDTTAAGYNAAVETPVFISGHPNFDALDLPTVSPTPRSRPRSRAP